MHVAVNETRLWFDVDGPALVPDGPSDAPAADGRPPARRPGQLRPLLLQARLRTALERRTGRLLGSTRTWPIRLGDPESWSFETAADQVRAFCDAVGIARPVVYGHSLGSFVAMVYAIRHPRHPKGLVLQSAFARFDLGRIVDEFRRAGGDAAAATAKRAYGGDGAPVTAEEWAASWRLFGPWVTGETEEARTVVNADLNAPGLALMRSFDVVDQLSRIDCPTLVCVGELDPITPVKAAREIFAALPAGLGRLEVLDDAGHFTWKDAPERYWPLLSDFVASTADE